MAKTSNTPTKKSQGPKPGAKKAAEAKFSSTDNPAENMYHSYLDGVEEFIPKAKNGVSDLISFYAKFNEQAISMGETWLNRVSDNKDAIAEFSKMGKSLNAAATNAQKEISSTLFDMTSTSVKLLRSKKTSSK